MASLIGTGGAIRGHCPGIGSRPVRDCFGRGAGVGCPGGVGTGRLFAGWRISWTRLILRGVVSAAGKKHQGDQWYDYFHSFWSFRLFDTRPVRSPILAHPGSWLMRSCDICSLSAMVSYFSLVLISVAFGCKCFLLRLSACLAGNRLAFFAQVICCQPAPPRASFVPSEEMTLTVGLQGRYPAG